MASRSSLLVDLGAPMSRSAVFRTDEGIVAETQLPVPAFASLDGPYRTIDPTEVVKAVEAAIASAVPQAENPERILLSGQMHGWTLTDERNVPHLPLITWQDNRALLARNGIHVTLINCAIGAAGGVACRWERAARRPPGFGHLRYRSHENRRSSSRAQPAVLGGRSVDQQAGIRPARHRCGGLWHVRPRGRIVVRSGHRSCRWRATPVAAGVVAPEVVGVHRASGAAVFTPVGDQQAALLGAGIGEDVTAFNIATGGQVARLAREHAGYRCQTRPSSTGCCSTPGLTCRLGVR